MQEAAARASAIAARKGAQMRQVMKSQLYSSDKISRAFDLDWKKLDNSLLRPIDR